MLAALALTLALGQTPPAAPNPGDNATSSQSPAYVFQPPAPRRPPDGERPHRPPATPPRATNTTAASEAPSPSDVSRPR